MEWIDGDTVEAHVGLMGFLIRRSNPIRHTEHAYIAQHPPRTNQSHELRIYGWCGSWNDTNTYGDGIVRVTRVARNGRVQIVSVTNPDDLAAYLHEVGYPELMAQALRG